MSAQSRVVSWEGASLEDQILQTAASTLFMASHGAGGINYIWLKVRAPPVVVPAGVLSPRVAVSTAL